MATARIAQAAGGCPGTPAPGLIGSTSEAGLPGAGQVGGGTDAPRAPSPVPPPGPDNVAESGGSPPPEPASASSPGPPQADVAPWPGPGSGDPPPEPSGSPGGANRSSPSGEEGGAPKGEQESSLPVFPAPAQAPPALRKEDQGSSVPPAPAEGIPVGQGQGGSVPAGNSAPAPSPAAEAPSSPPDQDAVPAPQAGTPSEASGALAPPTLGLQSDPTPPTPPAGRGGAEAVLADRLSGNRAIASTGNVESMSIGESRGGAQPPKEALDGAPRRKLFEAAAVVGAVAPSALPPVSAPASSGSPVRAAPARTFELVGAVRGFPQTREAGSPIWWAGVAGDLAREGAAEAPFQPCACGGVLCGCLPLCNCRISVVPRF